MNTDTGSTPALYNAEIVMKAKTTSKTEDYPLLIRMSYFVDKQHLRNKDKICENIVII